MPNPNRMSVEFYPAGFGDAILLRCLSGERFVNILVDGGVRRTYQDHLRDRLLELRSRGEKLDLLVVTHIDSDHIGGALSLLEANGRAADPAIIEIGDIWHNGYRHLSLRGRQPSDDEKRKVFAQVSSAEETGTQLGDISVREGDTLASLISEGGYAWNSAWGGKAIVAGTRGSVAPHLDLTILSPTPEGLDSLAYHWRRGLQSMGVSYEAVDCKEFEIAYEKFATLSDDEAGSFEGRISARDTYEPPDPSTFVEDTSKTNGSSIAFLLDCAGVRGLFLGDAWPSVIVGEWGKLPEDVRRPVDVLKVSHHGSLRNTSPTLLQQIAANHYLVSSDGTKHGHPELGTLLWVADQGQKGAKLVFNYPTDSANRMNEPPVKARFGHQVILGDGITPVRLEFNDEAPDVAAKI